ncbi:oxygen-dependent tRNA uridine(34) hydroxylase TrhO [Flavobacterium gawalongense]|uniref:tRNA uridine(34) hydroxylase n=1 Tax=Flavobacterium gawalongense TaxID=2594432 RepID=A0A553BK42_9FLAO|nr:rhodanese-related sulfurtransferase [Flavobacterium gawalongense]TRX00337.1 rhodanese-related sulfurtransferase [Flavobacterium gawalongense]TRX08394.1 rhodanese-related sulfurtransferase [Flavobacterium gawalongense]TRX08609.1 rhodanese-related sulfurtransferase [Flavobacterium gawalongense]TRX09592.1 rhodanese-related sulfurtransferase [Flavobacterium gawalongense]TRX25601.1 rhodanese-related sulfurtransferase [Flavobacterium gawalongense]
MQLYNTLSAEERAIMIDDAGKQRLTLSFYAYAQISDPTQFRNELFLAWNSLEVLGRIYVAHEGINAQLSLPADNFYAFKDSIEVYDFMKGIRLNIAVEHNDHSFLKLTVKVRDKIVADGLVDETFDVTNIGIHLKAKEFNELLEDPNTIVVDMRNHYESEIGHFTKAIKPDVDTFRESLPIIEEQLAEHKQDKKLLMYCTGGIRCEKASAYFKHKGFENVYQLEGGIIEYTRQIKAEGLESKFIGKNFVFDHRLGERITDDIVSQCHQCGKPCDIHTNCVNEGCHLLFIQCEECATAMEGCCSQECVRVIHLPEEEQKAIRRGIKNGNKIFKKGKSDVLTFKNNEETHSVFVADPSVSELAKQKPKTAIKKEPKVKKVYIGKGTHFFPKPSIGQFLIEDNEIKIGDTILIKGATTGEQKLVIEEMLVNDLTSEKAVFGDTCTFKLPFRIRLSDKLYKILD